MTPADLYPGPSPRGRLPVKGPLPLLGPPTSRASHFRGLPRLRVPPLGTGGPGSLPPIDPPASTGGSTRAQALAGLSVRPRGPAHPAPPPEPSHAANWQLATGKWTGARARDRQGLGASHPANSLPPLPGCQLAKAPWETEEAGRERGLSRKEKTSSRVVPQKVGPIPFRTAGRVPFGIGFAGNISAPAPGTHPRDLGGGPGVLPPSRPPALPGTMMGRCVLHKSSQGSG